MYDLKELPKDLPIPEDDGVVKHLEGKEEKQYLHLPFKLLSDYSLDIIK
jgi:hypothetical protein